MPNEKFYSILEEIEKERNMSWTERVENSIRKNKIIISKIKGD